MCTAPHAFAQSNIPWVIIDILLQLLMVVRGAVGISLSFKTSVIYWCYMPDKFSSPVVCFLVAFDSRFFVRGFISLSVHGTCISYSMFFFAFVLILVSKMLLQLHEGVRKSGIMGFCDPCPGEPKLLHVEFTYGGKRFEVLQFYFAVMMKVPWRMLYPFNLTIFFLTGGDWWLCSVVDTPRIP